MKHILEAEQKAKIKNAFRPIHEISSNQTNLSDSYTYLSRRSQHNHWSLISMNLFKYYPIIF